MGQTLRLVLFTLVLLTLGTSAMSVLSAEKQNFSRIEPSNIQYEPLDRALANDNMGSFELAYFTSVANAAHTNAAHTNGASLSAVFLPRLSLMSATMSPQQQNFIWHGELLQTDNTGLNLYINMSPARLLYIIWHMQISDADPLNGGNLMIDATMFDQLAARWQADVLNQDKPNKIENFSHSLPAELKFLTAIFNNSGTGGFYPFERRAAEQLDDCLLKSLPFLQQLIELSWHGKLSDIQKIGLNAYIPKCLTM